MILHEQKLAGVFLIERKLFKDERGSFARLFCTADLIGNGLEFKIDQVNLSINSLKHTLRGFHIQKKPHSEAKILSVMQGKIFNVVIDLRKESLTYLQWQSFELEADNDFGLLVPEGCANAFMTLKDQTQVLYFMDEPYHAVSGFNIRYNDPQFQISWPFEPKIISEKDRSAPPFQSQTWED